MLSLTKNYLFLLSRSLTLFRSNWTQCLVLDFNYLYSILLSKRTIPRKLNETKLKMKKKLFPGIISGRMRVKLKLELVLEWRINSEQTEKSVLCDGKCWPNRKFIGLFLYLSLSIWLGSFISFRTNFYVSVPAILEWDLDGDDDNDKFSSCSLESFKLHL